MQQEVCPNTRLFSAFSRRGTCSCMLGRKSSLTAEIPDLLQTGNTHLWNSLVQPVSPRMQILSTFSLTFIPAAVQIIHSNYSGSVCSLRPGRFFEQNTIGVYLVKYRRQTFHCSKLLVLRSEVTNSRWNFKPRFTPWHQMSIRLLLGILGPFKEGRCWMIFPSLLPWLFLPSLKQDLAFCFFITNRPILTHVSFPLHLNFTPSSLG